MNIEEEVKEYRKHTNLLEVDGNKIRVITIENIEFMAEVTSNGIFIISCSESIDRAGYDDLGQLLTNLSQAYRDSFANELIEKLNKLNED